MSKEALNMARIAEQTERYEDMVRWVREAIRAYQTERGSLDKWLGESEMRLLGAAYKCKINSRRTAWRALSILYAKEANSKNRSSAIIQLYKQSIEKEIREITQQAIAILDSLEKSKSLTTSLRLQLCKMRGDFHRYLCEIAKDTDELKKLQRECETAYRRGVSQIRGQERSKKEGEAAIEAYDPRRLAIYLNLSVFYYQIMGAVGKAIDICQQGFTAALESISDLQETKYIDSVTIMQLMHDSITAWRTQKEQNK